MHARVERNTLVLDKSSACVPDIVKQAYADINAAVAIFDDHGSAVYLNAEMQKLEAASSDGVARLADLTPHDRTSAAFIDFERFRAGRIDMLKTRYAINRKSGTLLWMDLSAQRRKFAANDAPLIVVTILDVSDLYQARTELIRNNTRWEAALLAAGQGMWEHDSETETLTVSQGWKRLRGIPDDEDVTFSREEWLARLHPEDRDMANAGADKQARGEGSGAHEYRERHRDGHYIWIYSRGRPYAWDENGKPLRTIGTDTDITQPKAVENELALEKERLHVTLQSIADGVISTDEEGTVTFINKAAVRMTGWSADDALGQPIETVFDAHVEGAPGKRTRTVRECLKRGKVCRHSGYSRLKAKSGAARYVREIAAPLLDEHARVLGAVKVFQDSTQLRRYQRELQHSATHDSLTGLPNRAAFETCLETQIQQAAADGSTHAVCMIDLDKFKAVNDGAGHSAGDALLKQIGEIIKSSCRHGDCVARLGGDEFAVILKNSTIKSARQMMRKIISRIGTLTFDWHGQSFRVGASIGITAIDGTIPAIDLYRNADNACYAAKRNGRGCEVVFG